MVANSVCHLFILWLLNCVCISFLLVFVAWCASICISSWIHLFTFLKGKSVLPLRAQPFLKVCVKIILADLIRKFWIQPWDRNSYPTQVRWKPRILTCLKHWLYWTSRRPLLRLTSLNLMPSLNATVMSSQYVGRQQSKWLHYWKILRSEIKGVKEKESIMGVRGR